MLFHRGDISRYKQHPRLNLGDGGYEPQLNGSIGIVLDIYSETVQVTWLFQPPNATTTTGIYPENCELLSPK